MEDNERRVRCNWWLNFCNGGTGNKLTPKERLLFGEPALETIKEQGDRK